MKYLNLILIFLILNTIIIGCGTTATIIKKNGTRIETEITGSNSTSVYVGTNKSRISNSEIEDIDHPGNVVGGFGAALTAYGVLNILAISSMSDQEKADYVKVDSWEEYDQKGPFYFGAYLPFTAGAGMLAYGLYVWNKSKSAAKNYENQKFTLIPQIYQLKNKDKTDKYYGLSLALNY